MNSALKTVLFALGTFGPSAAAVATDKDDPTGTWTVKFKLGNTVVEQALVMEHKGGKVTGTLTSGKDVLTEIEEGTFKDGALKIIVTRGTGNLKSTATYEGKVAGNTFKGVASFDFRGAVTKNDFEATREKKKD